MRPLAHLALAENDTFGAGDEASGHTTDNEEPDQHDACTEKRSQMAIENDKSADYWIDKLDLKSHPEGGYYREVYRSPGTIPSLALPDRFAGRRVFSTSIFFLLRDDQFSAFHRIKSDEIWHFYALVGGTVAPGFDFVDFEMADRSDLLESYPQHAQLITSLTC